MATPAVVGGGARYKIKKAFETLGSGTYPPKYRLFASDIRQMIDAIKDIRKRHKEKKGFEAAKPKPEGCLD